MLAEFITKIVDLGQRARQAEFHEHEQVPHRLWLRNGEKLEEVSVPPPLRQHTLAGFDDLVRALKNPNIAPRPEVYVSACGIAAYLDGSDRREVVTVPLQESARFQLCARLQQQPAKFQPKDLVKMLKLEFHGGNHGHVVQALSRIDFVRTSSGRTNVAHGKESLGRSIEAAVQQAEDVPERFTLHVPIWTTPGFSRFSGGVEFGVHLDLEGQTVELRVLSDEVERVRILALQAVVAELVDRLIEAPVFLGAP